MKAILAVTIVALLIGLCFVSVVRANPFSFPQSLPNVVIAKDGSINPPTDSISHSGNTYTLTRDVSGIYCLQILCSGIIFDGNGNSLVGGRIFEKPTGITVTNAQNLTLRNMEISSFYAGVYLF